MPGHCAKCPARWSGYNTAHCGTCHRTFTGIGAFDKHRTGSHTASTRRCLTPETVGLVVTGRKYECYGEPSDGNEWWNE